MPVTAAVVGGGLMLGGTVHQIDRSKAAQRDQRRAADRQKEASRVSQAQQERERQLAIRQQQRQERIRRAQVISAAEAAGVSGASVEASTIGSGQTIAAAGQAFATGASMASRRIGMLQQQAMDFQTAAGKDQVSAQIGGAVAQVGGMMFSAAAPSAFGPTTTTTTNYAAPSNMSSVNPKIAQMPLSM